MNIYDTVMDSTSHPLTIHEIPVPGLKGKIGISIVPGKKGPSLQYCSDWNRDLDADISIVTKWGAKAVLTLIEDYEFGMLGVEELPEKVRAKGMYWFHLPIEDISTPDHRFTKDWPDVCCQLLQTLRDGGNVLAHCKGGIGRSGLVCALLLQETGMSAERAIDTVRRCRPGAIETFEQEEFVRDYQPVRCLPLLNNKI